MRCLSLFGERIDAMLDAVPYGRFASIGGKTKCVKMNETLNQWIAL